MLNKAVSLNRHSRKLRFLGNAAQRGLSLIEVLFVIVILIIGILTIAQIFPIGFGGLRAAGNTSLAERMASQQLDKLRSDPGGVPDGIYSQYMDSSGNVPLLYFDPTVKRGDLTDYTRNIGPSAVRYNRQMRDINKTRTIYGESWKIAAQRVNVNGAASNPVHALNFAPIFLPAGLDWSQFISVYSGDWSPRLGNSELTGIVGGDPNTQDVTDKPTDYLTAGQPGYLVDYTNQRIAVAPQPFEQSFYFQVDVIDTATGARSTVPVQFKLPASTANPAYTGLWFPENDHAGDSHYYKPVPDITGWPYDSAVPKTKTWVVGSARLYRPFTYAASVAGFVNPNVATDPQDPYQFTLANPNFGTSDVNPGVLAFPASAAQPGIGSAIVAKVSYTTFDWHLLHEDRDVSPGANIRLTMHDLKKVGEVGESGAVYPGLIPNIGTGNDNYDVILMDLDTGSILSYTDTQSNDLDQASAGPVAGRIGISYRNGRLTLPADLSNNVNHMRIFYSTTNDLGVAVQMAPKTYHQVPLPADVVSILDSSTPNRYAIETGLFLDFPACDQGKSIQLSGVSYTDTGSTADGIAPKTRSVPALQILLPAPDPATKMIHIYLGNYTDNTELGSSPDSTKPFSVNSIVGLSATTVAVWRENGIWKQRSLETTVGRS